jgi:hypothetical protein
VRKTFLLANQSVGRKMNITTFADPIWAGWASAATLLVWQHLARIAGNERVKSQVDAATNERPSAPPPIEAHMPQYRTAPLETQMDVQRKYQTNRHNIPNLNIAVHRWKVDGSAERDGLVDG